MNPNIILILCDDLGYGDVSALNPQSKIKTKNIDQIVESGISFNDTHTSSAVCTPSRYSLLTGRYNFRSALKSGVNWGYSPPLIENDRLTLAQMLKNSGYSTSMIGKWHLGLDWKTKSGKYVSQGGKINEMDIDPDVDFSSPVLGGPIQNGFEYFFGIPASLDMAPYVYIENDLATSIPTESNFQNFSSNIDGLSIKQQDSKKFNGIPGPVDIKMKPDRVLNDITKKAVEIIDRDFNKNSPSFLYFSLTAPHTPVSPSKNFIGKSGTKDQYLDFVLEVDDVVGQILSAVKRTSNYDNTLIIFTSDNGPERFMKLRQKEISHYSAAQFRGCKRDNWEGGHRIPFLVQWPSEISHKSESNVMISLVDVFATISKIIKNNYEDYIAEDSYDFSSVLLRKSKHNFEREFLIHHSASGFFGIRNHEWKLLIHEGSGSEDNNKSIYSNELSSKQKSEDNKINISSKGPIQLYNILNDEHEDSNLYFEHPDIVQELSTKFLEIIRNGRSTPGAIQPNFNEDNSWSQVIKSIDILSKVGVKVR